MIKSIEVSPKNLRKNKKVSFAEFAEVITFKNSSTTMEGDPFLGIDNSTGLLKERPHGKLMDSENEITPL